MTLDGLSTPAWRRWSLRLVPLVCAAVTVATFPRWWCARGADAFADGDDTERLAMAAEAIALENADDGQRAGSAPAGDRYAGEWALVTHQMNALGLAQLVIDRPEWRERLGPAATRAAAKTFLPEMRDFGTRAWHEDGLSVLEGDHGHAYLGYPALAVSMARLVDPAFPAPLAARHDALIRALERRLRGSPTGLIETYPGRAYPTDVAAVAAAIAVHARATGRPSPPVIAAWAARVRARQIDPASGFVMQCMDARTGAMLDAPRASGTGLAAYFAGFADRALAALLADALLAHTRGGLGFDAIQEYADGRATGGDVDSGPVVLGVSVAATGFALAPAHAFGRRDAFVRLYRTVHLFGVPVMVDGRRRFATGGPIGNALLFAFLTSGPELAS